MKIIMIISELIIGEIRKINTTYSEIELIGIRKKACDLGNKYENLRVEANKENEDMLGENSLWGEVEIEKRQAG
ncbi:hypothetical protein KHA93_00255 [Bacillus sp. FJAT-49732]|uniref:Uncharacterized protein n=1 Tax=Lederbergia citrisecunda TaxID=2833583 RepID=A0A942TJV2_9BACI|nr:hypothetical protein [Lederbergia citrisecunda]MBS4198091.1 hypothetical protein [Lederbergia citrisecunda]